MRKQSLASINIVHLKEKTHFLYLSSFFILNQTLTQVLECIFQVFTPPNSRPMIIASFPQATNTCEGKISALSLTLSMGNLQVKSHFLSLNLTQPPLYTHFFNQIWLYLVEKKKVNTHTCLFKISLCVKLKPHT